MCEMFEIAVDSTTAQLLFSWNQLSSFGKINQTNDLTNRNYRIRMEMRLNLFLPKYIMSIAEVSSNT